LLALHERLFFGMDMATRGKTRKDYKTINEYGFDEQFDILDISDPASGMFDTEIEGEGLQGQIEALKLDITNTVKEIIEEENKWKKLYNGSGSKGKIEHTTKGH
jgi:hypothetical protein